MRTALVLVQTVVSVLLILAILVQQKGSGLSGALTGSGQGTAALSTKRGAEKVVFRATIVLGIIFVAISLAFIFVA